MADPLTPQEQAVIDGARRLARDVLAPGAAGWEEREEFGREAFRALCRPGLGGAVLPASVGGAGLSHRAAVAVFEELAAGDMATAFALLCQNSSARSIWSSGSAVQQARWLPALMSGDCVAAYAITEPQAGSDAAAMTTRAERSGDGWVLGGAKTLVSNAPVADLFIVSAKTDPAAGARGITSFVLPRDTPGLEVGPRQHTIGARAVAVGGLRLQDCRVGADAQLGPLGGGFKLALEAVNFARIIWGGLTAGVARAALEHALGYLKERRQFGRPLVEFQAVAFQLADLATEIEASRQLAQHAAGLMDRGEPYVVAGAMAKRFAGDMAVRVTSAALELLGGHGYVAPSPLDRYARQARMAQLADGAANIQRLVIARALL